MRSGKQFHSFCPKAEAYERRRKVNSLGKVDARGGRDASVEDFDILDRGRTSVEDFDVEVFNARDFEKSDKGRTSVEDFGGKKSKSETQIGVENFGTFRFPTKENTKRRTLSSSWSSWAFSQKLNFNFPTRTRVKSTEKPRSRRTMPDDFSVERIVIFPCQEQNLRCTQRYNFLFTLNLNPNVNCEVHKKQITQLSPFLSIIIEFFLKIWNPYMYSISHYPGVIIFRVTRRVPTTANGRTKKMLTMQK